MGYSFSQWFEIQPIPLSSYDPLKIEDLVYEDKDGYLQRTDKFYKIAKSCNYKC